MRAALHTTKCNKIYTGSSISFIKYYVYEQSMLLIEFAAFILFIAVFIVLIGVSV